MRQSRAPSSSVDIFAGRGFRRSTSAARLTRRSLLGGAAALAAGLGGTRPTSAAGDAVPFGAAVAYGNFRDDADYRNALLEHCDLIMPMNELKFAQVHPEPGRWNFEPADAIVDFALRNGRTSRGHAHVWWGATPDWVEAIGSEKEAEAALVEHIETVQDRYRGRLLGWDVVNEVIANDPETEGALRDTVWLDRLGPRHIPLAFQAASQADPDARLVLNDYDLEFAGRRYDLRREIALGIVRQLLDANIPVHGVGIQAHLYVGRTIDRDALLAFHKALDEMGVSLLVTELDVINWESAPDAQSQDRAAGALVSDLLEGVFAWKAPELVVAWGLTDRYSWIEDVQPRPDGAPGRPLPLDRDMKPKPWLRTLKHRLSAG